MEAVEEKVEEAKETAEEVKEAAEEQAAEVAEAVEEKAEEAQETAEEVKEAVEEKTEEVAETVTGAAEAVAEAVTGEGKKVMTHAEYVAAADDDEVVIEAYVQDHQNWWDGKVKVYLQDQDGGYFAYDMLCSEEDAAKLVPGTKIRVMGYKTTWGGEIEIAENCTFEFVKAEPWIAEPLDVTALVGTDELAAHMNERVIFKGATVVAQEDGQPINYKNPEDKTDDTYLTADVNGTPVKFCVEFYLRNN